MLLRGAMELDDVGYLHWEELRHRSPPSGLSDKEWWLALKFKRLNAQMSFAELKARNDAPLKVTRHPRLDAGMARLDRQMAGSLASPGAVQLSSGERDQYLTSSLMEEAIHSSLFEGAVSTREAAKEMLRQNAKPTNRDERMILNNYRAMQRIRALRDQDMSVPLLLELHSILTDQTLDKPECAGRFQLPGERRIEVIDERSQRVVNTPPPAEQLPQRMARLMAFANAPAEQADRYVPPVLRAILLHFQLAYDHPFYDGNGRTARALFYWSMLRQGYWLTEFISISRPLLRNRGAYERAYLYTESDEQDATYFVLQQLDVLQQAQGELSAYIERKTLANATLRSRIRNRQDLNHRQIALLDHALRHPEVQYTHESHANSHHTSIVTARADLQNLVRAGFLVGPIRVGKRFIYSPVDGLGAQLDRSR